MFLHLQLLTHTHTHTQECILTNAHTGVCSHTQSKLVLPVFPLAMISQSGNYYAK